MEYKKIWGAVMVLGFATLLVGCKSEPSESDIQSAIQQNVEQTNQQAKSMGGKALTDNMLMKVENIKKLACQDAQSDGSYKCKVEMEMTAPFVGKRQTTGELTFIESDDGWRVVQ